MDELSGQFIYFLRLVVWKRRQGFFPLGRRHLSHSLECSARRAEENTGIGRPNPVTHIIEIMTSTLCMPADTYKEQKKKIPNKTRKMKVKHSQGKI
jgi:hypothetical protein